MSSDRIAITGSTGHIGGRVARGLAQRGVPLRLLVREASRAPELPDAEVFEGSYADADTYTEAFDGIDTLFFVSAPQSADFLRKHDTFCSAAMSAGVQHVVYLSYYGAMRDASCSIARSHWHTEQILRDRCPRWTFLRDNVYADALYNMVGPDNVIRAPAKRGKVAPVDPADIVDVALEVLTNPARHKNVDYNLTGPESFTLKGIAELLTEASGRQITYQNQSVAEAYRTRSDTAEPWLIEVWVSMYVAIARGEMGDVTDDVQRVLGRPPTPVHDTLRRYFEENPGIEPNSSVESGDVIRAAK